MVHASKPEDAGPCDDPTEPTPCLTVLSAWQRMAPRVGAAVHGTRPESPRQTRAGLEDSGANGGHLPEVLPGTVGALAGLGGWGSTYHKSGWAREWGAGGCGPAPAASAPAGSIRAKWIKVFVADAANEIVSAKGGDTVEDQGETEGLWCGQRPEGHPPRGMAASSS